MWHVRKMTTMQTSTAARFISQFIPSSCNSFIDEIEKEKRHVAREEDNDNADQHCSQVHLTVHIVLPAIVSLIRCGMWHVRKTMTMQTSIAAKFISRFVSFFLQKCH